MRVPYLHGSARIEGQIRTPASVWTAERKLSRAPRHRFRTLSLKRARYLDRLSNPAPNIPYIA
jgi:hypothetical protein